MLKLDKEKSAAQIALKWVQKINKKQNRQMENDWICARIAIQAVIIWCKHDSFELWMMYNWHRFGVYEGRRKNYNRIFARTNRCYFIYDRHCGFLQYKLCGLCFYFLSLSLTRFHSIVQLKLGHSADILSLTNVFHSNPFAYVCLLWISTLHCDHSKWIFILVLNLDAMQMFFSVECLKLAQKEQQPK